MSLGDGVGSAKIEIENSKPTAAIFRMEKEF